MLTGAGEFSAPSELVLVVKRLLNVNNRLSLLNLRAPSSTLLREWGLVNEFGFEAFEKPPLLVSTIS